MKHPIKVLPSSMFFEVFDSIVQSASKETLLKSLDLVYWHDLDEKTLSLWHYGDLVNELKPKETKAQWPSDAHFDFHQKHFVKPESQEGFKSSSGYQKHEWIRDRKAEQIVRPINKVQALNEQLDAFDLLRFPYYEFISVREFVFHVLLQNEGFEFSYDDGVYSFKRFDIYLLGLISELPLCFNDSFVSLRWRNRNPVEYQLPARFHKGYGDFNLPGENGYRFDAYQEHENRGQFKVAVSQVAFFLGFVLKCDKSSDGKPKVQHYGDSTGKNRWRKIVFDQLQWIERYWSESILEYLNSDWDTIIKRNPSVGKWFRTRKMSGKWRYRDVDEIIFGHLYDEPDSGEPSPFFENRLTDLIDDSCIDSESQFSSSLECHGLFVGVNRFNELDLRITTLSQCLSERPSFFTLDDAPSFIGTTIPMVRAEIWKQFDENMFYHSLNSRDERFPDSDAFEGDPNNYWNIE